MDRIAPSAEPRRRAGAVARQALAVGLAIIGHAGVAIAMHSAWVSVPVSNGSPPPAISVELVAASDAVFDKASDKVSATPGETSPAPATGPPPQIQDPARQPPTVERSENTNQAFALKRVDKPPDRTRVASVRPNVGAANERSERKGHLPVRSDSGVNDPQADKASAVFGHTSVATSVSSSWKSRLLAHLERFKRYPDNLRNHGQEGTSLLSFTLDREGRVLDFFVARSSGSDDLDKAALAMIEGASPVPPVPDDMVGATVQLVVPVRFSTR